VLLIARHGKVAYFENIGFLDPQAKSPMPKNAMFHIYSMSKPITTVVAMILFEEGKITLDESIGKYIPALTNPQVVDQSLLLGYHYRGGRGHFGKVFGMGGGKKKK
jgi:CubicO group peptidase (beta-lactamase class C family)